LETTACTAADRATGAQCAAIFIMRLRKLKDVPFFPVFPFVPLLLIGGVITLQAISIASFRKVTRRLDALLGERMTAAAS
jgi:hypothetical protein